MERTGFDFRPIETTAADLEDIACLLRIVWPQAQHLDSTYLHWLYVQNPAGCVIGFNAFDGSQLVAHYAVVPIRARVHGQLVRAALSLNTATHPLYRGKGLVTTLASFTYEAAAAQGCHHIIGVANHRSTPVLVRKLGFQHVGPLEARVSLLPPRLSYASLEHASWVRCWEPREWAWRLANPRGKYSWKEWHGGVLWLAHTNELGIRAILRADPEICAKLTATHFLRRDEGWFPLLWLGHSRLLRFPKGLSLNLPMRVRRSPLNLVYLPLVAGEQRLAGSSIEFSPADFDAY